MKKKIDDLISSKKVLSMFVEKWPVNKAAKYIVSKQKKNLISGVVAISGWSYGEAIRAKSVTFTKMSNILCHTFTNLLVTHWKMQFASEQFAPIRIRTYNVQKYYNKWSGE